MHFGICIHLETHPHGPDNEHIHYPPKFLMALHSTSFPQTHPPSPGNCSALCHCSLICIFQNFKYMESYSTDSLFGLILSLGIIILRFTYVVCISSSLFIAEYCSTDRRQFVYLHLFFVCFLLFRGR